ncbi:MAG TPA: hypothetical protein VGN13_05745 [Solirubrobacteraceae bacterium]|jgi:hypothetical protein
MPGAARASRAEARRRPTVALRALAAGLAGVAAALLVSCGSSGRGLIPASAAGPLKSDFEAVQQAAETANGSCSATEAALRKTEEDFSALPSSVDAGLRSNLHQGIANLRVRAHEMCVQPGTQTATTTTATTTSTPPPTTSTATTTPTQSTPATTPTTSGPGGGTAAPGEGETPEAGDGNGKGNGKGNGHGGTDAGEGGAGGVGAGEPEGGK